MIKFVIALIKCRLVLSVMTAMVDAMVPSVSRII